MSAYHLEFNLNQLLTNKKLRKFNFNILLSNTIISTIFIICLVLFFYFYNFITPYPERTKISEMTPEMIANGEDKSLIIILTFAFASILLAIGHIIISLMVLMFYFCSHQYLFLRYKWLNNQFFKWVFQILFVILYLVIAFILVYYFWFVYVREYKQKFQNLDLIITHDVYETKSSKLKKIAWTIIIALIPVIGVCCYFIWAYTPRNLYTGVDKLNVKKYFTLSNNHENVLMFTFDRSTGLIWNLLLYYESLVDKQNSFVNLFPEFEIFLNTLSCSSSTNFANPPLYGGSYFSQFLKNENLVNFATNQTNSEMTWNDWYYAAIKTWCQSYLNNNINDIGIANLPYYSKSVSSEFGNMSQLQSDLKQRDNIDIIGMDSPTIASDINYRLNNKDSIKLADLVCFDKFDNLMKFNNTSSGVFRTYYSQITHQKYCYKENNEYKIVGSEFNDFVKSQWYAIQTLKRILIKMKNTPFVDNNNNVVLNQENKPISVYDKTMIVMTSDHGYQYVNGTQNKFLDYLINKTVMTASQKSLLNSFNFLGYNNLFMFKDFTYNKNNVRNTNWTEFKFNDDQIIFITDIAIIMENLLKKYNNDNSLTSSFISNDINLNNQYNQVIKEQFLNDPLNPLLNSISNNHTLNRTLYISSPYDWKFEPNIKKINPRDSVVFNFNRNSNSIYNNANFIV